MLSGFVIYSNRFIGKKLNNVYFEVRIELSLISKLKDSLISRISY